MAWRFYGAETQTRHGFEVGGSVRGWFDLGDGFPDCSFDPLNEPFEH